MICGIARVWLQFVRFWKNCRERAQRFRPAGVRDIIVDGADSLCRSCAEPRALQHNEAAGPNDVGTSCIRREA
jgi:hypothetical protein